MKQHVFENCRETLFMEVFIQAVQVHLFKAKEGLLQAGVTTPKSTKNCQQKPDVTIQSFNLRN